MDMLTNISALLTELTIGEAAKTALFGYLVDFGGLVLLMAVLYCTGAYFKSRDKKKVEAEKNVTRENAAAPAPQPEAKLAPGSAGHIKLYNVSDREAAMIMAIVADKMQTPLHELHFISIKEVK